MGHPVHIRYQVSHLSSWHWCGKFFKKNRYIWYNWNWLLTKNKGDNNNTNENNTVYWWKMNYWLDLVQKALNRWRCCLCLLVEWRQSVSYAVKFRYQFFAVDNQYYLHSHWTTTQLWTSEKNENKKKYWITFYRKREIKRSRFFKHSMENLLN